jgi:hypothetical protein
VKGVARRGGKNLPFLSFPRRRESISHSWQEILSLKACPELVEGTRRTQRKLREKAIPDSYDLPRREDPFPDAFFDELAHLADPSNPDDKKWWV